MSRRLRDPRTLVASYPLNGHAQDVSGYCNDGVWNGTEAYNPFLKNSRQAGSFSSTSIDIADATEFDITDFTVSIWMKLGVVSAFIRGLIAKRDTFVTMDWHIHTQNGIVSAVFGPSAAFTLNGALVASLENWTHIAMTKVGSLITLYQNGVFDASGVSAVAWVNSDNLHIGNLNAGGGGSPFLGELADARIYNVALTQDEVLKLYHSPVPTY